MPKCDMNCFECKFDDCVVNRVLTPEQIQKNKEYDRQRYLKNREKYIERSRKWQEEHPIRTAEIKRKACKTYYRKHKEQRSQYFQERYRKLKEEKEKLLAGFGAEC